MRGGEVFGFLGPNRPVQRLEIEFGEHVDAEAFRGVPGVKEVHANGRAVTIGFEGSADES